VRGHGSIVTTPPPDGQRRQRSAYAGLVTDATAAAIAGELALLDPAVRSDRAAAARLIDPEFFEVGQGGRIWTCETILDEFQSARSIPEVLVSEMNSRELAAGVVLVTYISTIEGRGVRRSSIWRQSDAGWRVLFHQGTRIV